MNLSGAQKAERTVYTPGPVGQMVGAHINESHV
jgi:hypothetical protein